MIQNIFKKLIFNNFFLNSFKKNTALTAFERSKLVVEGCKQFPHRNMELDGCTDRNI